MYFNLQSSLGKHHRPCEFSGTPSPCANAHCEPRTSCLLSARSRPFHSLGLHLLGFLLPAMHDLGGIGYLLFTSAPGHASTTRTNPFPPSKVRCTTHIKYSSRSVSSFGFVALLSTVQALHSLTNLVPELCISSRRCSTPFLVHAIHFIVLQQVVFISNLTKNHAAQDSDALATQKLSHRAFHVIELSIWTLQFDTVFSSSSCFSCKDQTLLILTSKLDHFFTRASWATTVTLILADQLLAFIAERHDRRGDAETLQVLSNLKTCVFLVICKPLAN